MFGKPMKFSQLIYPHSRVRNIVLYGSLTTALMTEEFLCSFVF